MKYIVPKKQFERDVYFNLKFITKYLLSLKFILDEPLRLSGAIMCTLIYPLFIWLMCPKQSYFMKQPLL